LARRVAGLLLNYRDASRSIACIQSLLNEGIECVVVWDNSADGGSSAQAICETYAQDERIRIHISHENLGFAAGVNRGLKLCAAQPNVTDVLLINNDAVLLKGALLACKDAANDHPKAALMSMDVEHAGQRQGPMYYQRWCGLQFKRPAWGAFAYASGSCLWVALENAPSPLFDEDFFMYGEDCELGWRLRDRRDAWIHLPHCFVKHEGSAASGLGSPFYESRMVAAHILLARKLAGNPWQRLLFYVLRIPALLARASLRSLRYRSLAPWRALGEGIRLSSTPQLAGDHPGSE
jgi:N-acetylglucosaminyl-diphospho-decaprenol L-rhamnosyltransferase